jgi:malate/lactate dehydrogenase
VLRIRSVPAQWVDRIADEESSGLRVAFVTALAELAKSKTRDLDRILGLASYFLDDPAESVRDILVGVLVKLAELEGERVHYYLVEFEENAGTNRMAAICAVKDKMGW